ncbi:MAG: copper resistance protein CopC [Proteobacteria bacterium]|nr:copper resistance protein CopC [Pseudomonadota bacterium]
MRNALFPSLAAVAALTLAGGAQAHARLVSSDPAAGAKVSKSPAMIDLQFNERLEAKFSGFVVTRGGTSADVGPVSLDGPKGLMAMPAKALPSGAYLLHWHAVTADGHRTEGDVAFSIR